MGIANLRIRDFPAFFCFQAEHRFDLTRSQELSFWSTDGCVDLPCFCGGCVEGLKIGVPFSEEENLSYEKKVMESIYR